MAAAAPLLADSIRVRRMDLEFSDAIPTFWFDDNPFLTAVMAGLAVSFPPGERFFIRSVKHFLPKVRDEGLREAVKRFIGQEANHTKEHIAFNRFLDGRGLPATRMEQWVHDRITKIESLAPPEANLARTVALEHFTAILAAALLEHPEVTGRLAPETARLWLWHAVEELEHRSVAFDVYRETVDDEPLRLRMMALTTVVFALMNVIRTGWILRESGHLANVKAIRDGWRTLRTLFDGLGPRYRDFYRADFHPSQHDHEALIAEARARYLDEVA